MGIDQGTVSNLRRLATAQVTDETWLSAAEQACDIDLTLLTIDYWTKRFDLKHMGTVEPFSFPEGNGIRWNRPDEGMPIVITDNVPVHITLTRFLLWAGVIGGLKALGEVSYAKAGGPPTTWNQLKVYFNGIEFPNVLEADALLGTIIFVKRDEHGNMLTKDEKSEWLSTKISGIVKIVLTEAPLTFF